MKLFTVVLLVAFLTGCAGYRSVEPQLNPDGSIKRSFGLPVYKKVKKSESVAMVESIAPAIQTIQKNKPVPCDRLSIDDVVKLPEAVAIKYYESVEECHRSRADAHKMAYALGRPTNGVEALAQSIEGSIKHIQQGKTGRTRSVVTGLTTFGLGTVAGKVIDKAFEANRDVGIAAAENSGPVTVNGLTVDTGSSIGSSSNDSVAGGAEGLPGAAGATTTSEIVSNSEVNINLGRNNDQFRVSDTGRLNATDSNIQALEPSANGNLTEDSRQNGQITADEQNGDPSNQDNDGGNGLLGG